jgi:O-antigen/teichoic acid export membrane protein
MFPQTILIGLKKTRVVFWASVFEIILNIIVSLLLIPTYGIVGIPLGTALIHILEKIFLAGYNYYALNIAPRAYIPITWFLIYSALLVLEFELIDMKIIRFFQ